MVDNITQLRRDCTGILIPIGTEVILKKGSQVIVTQALGGSATINHDGNLIRISSENLDALDLDTSENQSVSESETNDGNIDMDSVWDQLRTCYDPEIPINIRTRAKYSTTARTLRYDVSITLFLQIIYPMFSAESRGSLSAN